MNNENQRIARNTLMLYFRMIIMMVIGFLTSRLLLKALGISDLGLMNVAGSVVAMFSFLNEALTSGTRRYLTVELEDGDVEKLKTTFSTALTMHLALAVIILILGETVGLWYVNNKLNVPEGRFDAAMWCYQLSLFSTFIGIVLVPFNSAIIAHEKMSMYAYMSIYDAAAKLLAAYLIMITPFDRLIFFSTLSFIIALIPTFIYNWYCRKRFEECSFNLGYDKRKFREMISFSSWNVLAGLSTMISGTGVDLVVNSFCGTIVNGAKSIASQANSVVTRFSDSFFTAINPQIIRNYASSNYERMSNLVCSGARYGAYILLILGIPLFVEIDFVLQIWLGQIPEHTPAFMRIMMVNALFGVIGRPTLTAIYATGRIKEVNLIVGGIQIISLLSNIVLFRFGLSPETVLLINIFPVAIAPLVRINFIAKFSERKFPIRKYLVETYVRTLGLTILMYIPPFLVHNFTEGWGDLCQFSSTLSISILSSLGIILSLGTNMTEKRYIKKRFLRK